MSETKEITNREEKIVRASYIGIGVNVLLAATKAVIGLLSHSIAIVLDAVNNLSDALSSLITIIGTKLAGKRPDKAHPLGYGRIEYLSALIISAIVLYAGVTSFVESVKKIIHPEAADYSLISLLILALAVVAKILLGTYMKRIGNEVSSGSLVASGSDALNDAVISSSVILSAIIYLVTGIKLEAIVGVVISLLIIKSGFELVQNTLDEILGKRPDSELSKSIKATVASAPEVQGAYDLVLHNYGPDLIVGSVHIEIPDTMTAKDIDRLTREITDMVYKNHHVILTGVSIYAYNTKDDKAGQIFRQVRDIVMAHDGVLQMHGFYYNEKTDTIIFDVVLDYSKNRRQVYSDIHEELKQAFPQSTIEMVLDFDISD